MSAHRQLLTSTILTKSMVLKQPWVESQRPHIPASKLIDGMSTNQRKIMHDSVDIIYFVVYDIVQAIIPKTYHRQISHGLSRSRLESASENRTRRESSVSRMMEEKRRMMRSLKSINGLTRGPVNLSQAHFVVFALAQMPCKTSGISLSFMCNDDGR